MEQQNPRSLMDSLEASLCDEEARDPRIQAHKPEMFPECGDVLLRETAREMGNASYVPCEWREYHKKYELPRDELIRPLWSRTWKLLAGIIVVVANTVLLLIFAGSALGGSGVRGFVLRLGLYLPYALAGVWLLPRLFPRLGMHWQWWRQGGSWAPENVIFTREEIVGFLRVKMKETCFDPLQKRRNSVSDRIDSLNEEVRSLCAQLAQRLRVVLRMRLWAKPCTKLTALRRR